MVRKALLACTFLVATANCSNSTLGNRSFSRAKHWSNISNTRRFVSTIRKTQICIRHRKEHELQNSSVYVSMVTGSNRR
ncbi:unnamed protein product [Callosobruchus maculatus]|uniref:Secreted protein n=1 Tax=Callosobruchus maculatus TaxID=64391 RepID=A0A653D6P5_CALMS|nr:unnamed protein product [Callosobruchus maculatus]